MVCSKRPSPNKGLDELLPPELLSRLLDDHQGARTCWIALSGGRDSTVLMDYLAHHQGLPPETNVRAIHIHHGLQVAANQWADHCAKSAGQYPIPLTVIRVNATPASGVSPEEAARDARYRAFRDIMAKGDYLLMAHHQEDQAETLLLQLLRGAGLEGLSGMAESSPFGLGTLLRPFLNVDQAKIKAYAITRGLRWIEDPSNQDVRFDRNFLRREVMPLLRTHWPAASRSLARSARHVSHAARAQKERQAELYLRVAPESHLNLHALATLNPHEKHLAVRGWFQSLDLRMPSEQTVETFIKEFLQSGEDRSPAMQLPDGCWLRRYRGTVYHLPHFENPEPCTWSLSYDPLDLPGNNGKLVMIDSQSPVLGGNLWDGAPLHVGYRKGGESIRIEGRQGHHALRDLFQEYAIPPWIRPRIPLLFAGDVLASVGGFWINADLVTREVWEGSRKPCWIPPDGLDPSGAIKNLRTRLGVTGLSWQDNGRR